MKWFNYLLKTPLGTICQDWKEYCKIGRDIKKADGALERAQSYLSRLCLIGDEQVKEEKSCLKQVEVVPPVGELIDDDNIRFYTRRCPYFYPVGDEVPCGCTECNYWLRNQMYSKHLERLKQLKQERRMYWGRKFENVK